MENIQERSSERLTHDYTSELELKSLLIRIKNDRLNFNQYKLPKENDGKQLTDKFRKLNTRINNRINIHTRLNSMDFGDNTKKNNLRRKIYSDVVKMSEKCKIDKASYERFGEIILLMIQRILHKPNFSRYSYVHDFYSLSVYNILKYLHNFDHTKISTISNQQVNAFAYISQYIHNSIIHVIKTQNRENENQSKLAKIRNIQLTNKVKSVDLTKEIQEEEIPEIIYEDIYLEDGNDLLSTLESLFDCPKAYNIYYPKDYQISLDNYVTLKEYMRPGINILRYKKEVN